MTRLRNQTVYLGDSLYNLLPEYWREEDHSPVYVAPEAGDELEELQFHQRFMRAMASGHDSILEAVNALLDWYDPLRCPEAELPRLALNSGWALDTSMSVTTQRLLIRKVFEMVYQRKGNIAAIESAVYALTGLPCKLTSCFSGKDVFIYRKKAIVSTVLTAGPLTSLGGSSVIQHELFTTEITVGDQIAIISEVGYEIATVSSISTGIIQTDRALQYQHPVGAQIVFLHDSETLSDVYGYGYGMRYGAGMRRVAFKYSGSVESGDCYGGNKKYTDGYCPNPATEDERRRVFTFVIKFFQIPTSLQLRITRRIVDYMKPARTHYRVEYDEIQPHGKFVYGNTRYGVSAVYQEA